MIFGWGSPEITDYLVHMVARPGRQPNVSARVKEMSSEERVESILSERRIDANYTFYAYDLPVVCFSEVTAAGIAYMITQMGYLPWGIVVKKDAVWRAGGSPVLYVRKDENHYLKEVDPILTNKVVTVDPPGGVSWMHEREWRIVYETAKVGFSFDREDVVAALIGDRSWSPSESGIGYDAIDGDLEEIEVPASWAQGIDRWLWTGQDIKNLGPLG